MFVFKRSIGICRLKFLSRLKPQGGTPANLFRMDKRLQVPPENQTNACGKLQCLPPTTGKHCSKCISFKEAKSLDSCSPSPSKLAGLDRIDIIGWNQYYDDPCSCRLNSFCGNFLGGNFLRNLLFARLT